jgi:hypothetical protein
MSTGQSGSSGSGTFAGDAPASQPMAPPVPVGNGR